MGCRDHPRWGGMVNELLTSHMFGENGLVRHCRRNASVTQESPGDGRLFQLSGMDFQAIMSREDPLSVRAKACPPCPPNAKPAAVTAVAQNAHREPLLLYSQGPVSSVESSAEQNA